MNYRKEMQLQKRIVKIRKLLDETSALLPADALVMHALANIHEAISKFSGQMIEYHSRSKNNANER